MLEIKQREDNVVVDKFVAPNADYTMSVRDQVMRVFADEDSGPIVITLPPVASAGGKFFAIVARDADGLNTVTIQDNNNDSECWNDLTMDGVCDEVLLYSDGMKWFILEAKLRLPPGGLTTDVPGTPAGTTSAP